MKYTRPNVCLSLDLLRYVRDARPTEADLLAWLGQSEIGRYYVLRKAGLLLMQGEVVVLSPRHLTPDGQHFWQENRRYNIDENTVDTFTSAGIAACDCGHRVNH